MMNPPDSHDATVRDAVEGPSSLIGLNAVLFLPASRPGAIEKARASAADLVILDLEDAVKAEDKARAREAAVEAVAQKWPMPVAVRVNALGTENHAQDIAALMESDADYLVLPQAHSAAAVNRVALSAEKPVMAMIESAEGVLAAREIAGKAVALIVGTNDLAASLRVPDGAGREPLQMALQSILLAARAAGIAAFDGVYNKLEDVAGFAAEAAEGRRLGFDGKTLIHPNQIDPCLKAFAATPDEVARAERLVAAATGGAERFEGAMIERMHVAAAKRLLERAR